MIKNSYLFMLVSLFVFITLVSGTACAMCDEDPISLKIISPAIEYTPLITATPSMPPLVFTSQLKGVDPNSVHSYSWKATLKYSWNSRKWEGSKPISYIESREFNASLNTPGKTLTSWAPVFYDGKTRVLMGGDLVVTVETTIGEKTYMDYREYRIKGLNPDKSEVKSQLGFLPYQIIAYKESGFIQFKDGEPYNSEGEEGASLSGYGIMQLDPPASYNQVWNWRTNVQGGIDKFTNSYNIAKKLDNQVRKYYHAKGKDKEIEKIESLNEIQALTQAYYAYNAGDPSKDGMRNTYWVWDTINNSWTINPNANPEGVSYAKHAIKIYTDIVEKNSYPKNWGDQVKGK